MLVNRQQRISPVSVTES